MRRSSHATAIGRQQPRRGTARAAALQASITRPGALSWSSIPPHAFIIHGVECPKAIELPPRKTHRCPARRRIVAPDHFAFCCTHAWRASGVASLLQSGLFCCLCSAHSLFACGSAILVQSTSRRTSAHALLACLRLVSLLQSTSSAIANEHVRPRTAIGSILMSRIFQISYVSVIKPPQTVRVSLANTRLARCRRGR